MSGIQSWHYQLQKMRIKELETSTADLLVIDYSRNGSDAGELTPEQLIRLQKKADGTARIVLAYLSIGEAEDYRYYWQPEWANTPPAFMAAENERWRGNHSVRFWHPEWKELIFASGDSYLERVQNCGFDGVYLDRVDVWESFKTERTDAAQDMIRFVTEIADTARERDPDFLVVAQNAEELLTNAPYRAVIDGFAKEDLLYGLAGDGTRNDNDTIAASIALIKRLQREGKPALTVEYLATHQNEVNTALAEHIAHGFIPTVTTRALDGA
jgi:cysteinyl-tRNA synthetase, unknown class